MNSSIKKNFIYNFIYQVLVILIPLIVAPYLSRVIGAQGVGIYSYTHSIVYYFMLFTLLGVNNYGNRSIAKVRDNKEKLAKTFWSIYFFQFIIGLFMFIIYLIYLCLFDISFKVIAFIQSLFIISSILDINWLYFGLEEIKLTITRNTFVKLGNLFLIFLLVKSEKDVWIYTLIMSGMTVLSQILLWSFIKIKVGFVKVDFKDIFSHIKPNLILFIPVIAVSLYKIMDKIMLGILSNISEVGFYENAEKIINIPITLIAALGTVMLPRISNLVSKNETEKINQYIHKSIKFIMFLSCAMCFGLIAIGYDFAPFFFGLEFQKTGILIMLLAPTLLFLSFANVLRTQYLIPNEMDKIYIISVSLGALINLILNLIFIPKYASIGACFGTIAAEFMVMFYQTMAVRKKLDIKKYIKDIFPFLIKALIMFIVIYPLNYLDMHSFLRLLLQTTLGGILYLLFNFSYIQKLFDREKKNIKKI